MAEIKELKPSTKERPKSWETGKVSKPEAFQEVAAQREARKRNENPLNMSEIFELINSGDITREGLDDFEMDPDLRRSLKWVVDLIQRTKKLEKTVEDQKSAIDQFESLMRERDITIDRLKQVIRDLEEKFPPLGGA